MTDAATDAATDADLDLAPDLEQGHGRGAASPPAHRIPWVFASWLILAGVIGEYAAFSLIVEKLHALANPGSGAACDINPIVQCTANLDSWQGALFGFPNPIIGLIGWMAPIVVGASLLAGARFARWYWIVFNLGVAGAMVFVIWLIGQSIYSIGTLCLYCMITWAVTIPTFLVVTLRNLAHGVYGERARAVGRAVLPWVAPVSLLLYVLILVLAQLQLSFVASLITSLT